MPDDSVQTPEVDRKPMCDFARQVFSVWELLDPAVDHYGDLRERSDRFTATAQAKRRKASELEDEERRRD